ncbi:cell division protein PerM [Luedemannella helvata]|uniref:Integral membrane protein n=1 Tax=Luedemannella helvata TaxID=349315 RepID=A0ABP4VSL8_9ACTN
MPAPTDDDADLATRDTVPVPAPRSERAADGARRVPVAVRRARQRAPLALSATVASGWAALTSLSVLFMVIAVGGLGASLSLPDVARFASAVWLLAHGVPLTTATDHVSLAPLAITALCAWRVVRAGVHASRSQGGHKNRRVRTSAAAAVAVAICYAGWGALLAALMTGPDLAASAPRAALTCFLFGLVGALGGALRASRAARAAVARLPLVVKDGIRVGVVAALLVVAAGAAAAGLALAVRGGEAVEMLGAYRTGVFGQAGVTVACLAYLPNLTVWATSYLLGPGFAVGVGAAVTPWAVVSGPVPALPVLAALPSAPVSGPAAVVVAGPLLAAVLAGVLATRRRLRLSGSRSVRLVSLIWSGVVAGPVAGALLGAAALVSRGGLGDGRLSTLGPVPWLVALCAGGIVGVGTVIGAAGYRGARPRGD